MKEEEPIYCDCDDKCESDRYCHKVICKFKENNK